VLLARLLPWEQSKTPKVRQCPEITAGPNWRAGFRLGPVCVPSSAIPIPIRNPTSQGTSGASRGIDRKYPTAKTITTIPSNSPANSGADDHAGAGQDDGV
jgi:hypothetical protein